LRRLALAEHQGAPSRRLVMLTSVCVTALLAGFRQRPGVRGDRADGNRIMRVDNGAVRRSTCRTQHSRNRILWCSDV
jgi:hypothetical protein